MRGLRTRCSFEEELRTSISHSFFLQFKSSDGVSIDVRTVFEHAGKFRGAHSSIGVFSSSAATIHRGRDHTTSFFVMHLNAKPNSRSLSPPPGGLL